MKKIAIIGAGGHGKVVADIALKNDYEEVIFFDDDRTKKECAGFKVIGIFKDIYQYRDYDFIVAIGNANIREKLLSHLEENNFSITTLVHPNASISRRVEIGKGSVVMAGSVINSDTSIGKGCIINTCSSVDHDCKINDFVHIAVGAHLSGAVTVEEKTWIGAGTTVSNNLNICSHCMIGAASLVIEDIKEEGTYFGVPAKKIK